MLGPVLQPLWNLCDRWLWGRYAERGQPFAPLLRLLRYPYAILRDLARGEINLWAMGLVFTTLLSLVPLLAFSFAVLKLFDAHRDLEPIVYEFFRPLGRDATEITARVMEFADSVAGGVVGSVGFALLVWTLVETIRKVEDGFNFLWKVERARGITRRFAEYLALLIVGPLLLVTFLGLAHSALESRAALEAVHLPILQRLGALLQQLSPYLVVTAIFSALYRFIPNTQVRIPSALFGGVVAGVLWAASGKLFTALVIYTARLTIVYAGFAVIIAALLWTYFGWLILLIGARLAFYWQNPGYLRLGLVEPRLSAEELEAAALRMMYLIGRAHVRAAPRWRVDALARELRLPGIAIAELVRALEAVDLLARTDDDSLIPGRDLARVPLVEVLEVARRQRSGHAEPQIGDTQPVERLLKRIDSAWRNACAGRSVRDLVDEGLTPTDAADAPADATATPGAAR
jgi:membrane protein